MSLTGVTHHRPAGPAGVGGEEVVPVAIHQRSVVELAAEEVCRLIFAGVYAPGERLFEERLTQQLGISRPPLREALRILTEQGLLEQVPRRGVRVMSLSEEDRREIYTLRHALEAFALREALPELDPAGLEAMQQALDEMWEAAHGGDVAGVLAANRSFHLGLVGLSGHQRLIRTYASLMRQMQLYMSVNLRTEAGTAGDLLEGCRRHERLLSTLRGGEEAVVLEELALHGASTYIEPSPLERDHQV